MSSMDAYSDRFEVRRGARAGREQTSLARLLVSENVGGVVEEVVRLLESSTLDQETAAKIRAKPSSERWTHEDFETVVEGLIRVGDGESRRAGESSLRLGRRRRARRGALDYLIATRGPGALALAAWRALSQFDCDDKRLAAWNATLMSHCPNPTDSSPDGPPGRDRRTLSNHRFVRGITSQGHAVRGVSIFVRVRCRSTRGVFPLQTRPRRPVCSGIFV